MCDARARAANQFDHGILIYFAQQKLLPLSWSAAFTDNCAVTLHTAWQSFTQLHACWLQLVKENVPDRPEFADSVWRERKKKLEAKQASLANEAAASSSQDVVDSPTAGQSDAQVNSMPVACRHSLSMVSSVHVMPIYHSRHHMFKNRDFVIPEAS